MGDPLKDMIDAGAIPSSAFAPNSRYHGLLTATYRPPGSDEAVVYVTRRFLPNPATLTPIGAHVVAQGDRLDLIAAQRLGDPLLFWRVADANGAVAPEELTDEVGRRLVLALPEGFGGGLA